MVPFPRNSRNTGEQGWDLAWMHLHISIKGSHLSFYVCAGFCPKDPVKKYLFRVIFFPLKVGLLLKMAMLVTAGKNVG